MQFQRGVEVLLLLADDNNTLLMHWKGPFTKVRKVNQFDYTIRIRGKDKTFNANF